MSLGEGGGDMKIRRFRGWGKTSVKKGWFANLRSPSCVSLVHRAHLVQRGLGGKRSCRKRKRLMYRRDKNGNTISHSHDTLLEVNDSA